MGETTPRFGLPLLEAGQAQKELFHNEALTLLETLVQPVAETAGDNVPPAAPVPGRSWIVGPAPTGAWANAAGALATWSAGGWRFVAPVDGMWVWVAADALWARRTNGAWLSGELRATSLAIAGHQVVGAQQSAIPAPSAGSTVDGEARAAIDAVLAALRAHGLIAV